MVGNAFGVVRSVPFTLNRFVNLAGRATVGVGERALISGFVIGTTLPIERRVLIRGVGPALAAFGVLDELEVPRLSVFKGSQLIATNAGWSRSENAAEIRDAAQRAGAFPLADGSADTAVLLSLAPGDYTAQITGAGDSMGTALVEIYDLEAPDRTRLKNLSVRARVAPGEHTLVGGLVIDGGVEKTVLFRAAGQALAAFGVDDFLRRPLLTVFRSGTAIATGAAWSAAANAAEIRGTTAALNAFAFSDGSDDAALLLRLAPGAYTVQVAGADGGSGVALLEIYESRPTVRPPSSSSND